jgi:uncharacterized membrane protein YgaE (UPF0421/DUF939 family)
MSGRTQGLERTLAPAATWLAPRAHAEVSRLRHSLWPITQTAVAAGLAYYIAHTLVGHLQPFFAPIAAAVAMSTSNDLRGQRALQLALGVALGIALGVAVETVLGSGAVSVGVAVFLALCVALVIGHGFIAQGMMFFNQTAAAAILVISLHSRTAGWDRLVDALIGGGVALVFSMLLFPPNPRPGVRRAAQSVFVVMNQELQELQQFMAGRSAVDSGWILSASEHIGGSLAKLDGARATAREIVRLAPRRRSGKAVVSWADKLAEYVTEMAGAVLTLGALTLTALEKAEALPADLEHSIGRLAAAFGAVAGQGGAKPADAEGSAEEALRSAAGVVPGPVVRAPVIASIVATCGRLVLDTVHMRSMLGELCRVLRGQRGQPRVSCGLEQAVVIANDRVQVLGQDARGGEVDSVQ